MEDTTIVNTSTESLITISKKKSFKLPFKKANIAGAVNKVKTANVHYNQYHPKHNGIYLKSTKEYERKIRELRGAIRILKTFDKELETLKLIERWREITKRALSYLLNNTLLKIEKLGGFEEFIRKEVDAEKQKIEYMVDDNLQNEINELTESDEFQALSQEEQDEYRAQLEMKLHEAESWKEDEFKKLESRLTESENKQMDMKELARRLKINYKMIFPWEEKS